jgi:hypothetical protein
VKCNQIRIDCAEGARCQRSLGIRTDFKVDRKLLNECDQFDIDSMSIEWRIESEHQGTERDRDELTQIGGGREVDREEGGLRTKGAERHE